jgi:hypothetical protein
MRVRGTGGCRAESSRVIWFRVVRGFSAAPVPEELAAGAGVEGVVGEGVLFGLGSWGLCGRELEPDAGRAWILVGRAGAGLIGGIDEAAGRRDALGILG